MRSVLSGTFEDNLAEATVLAETLRAMDHLPQPLVGRVHGPAMGGGVGFVSVTDIAVASTDAFFALSEVRVGLVPATISPFVMRRIGYPTASEMFLTGRKISAERAVASGLVNRLAPPDELDGAVEKVVGQLLANGPEALAASKQLLRQIPRMNPLVSREWTAHMIARRRQSAEGQEGMAAFLEKRPPSWR
jgi:methylglutaconyl-CoA hydratase